MRIVKYNPFKPFRSVGLDQFFDDFAGRSLSQFVGSDFVSATPSVNVIENDNSYVIEVAAPGLSKEDFNVDVENDLLVISARKEDKTENGENGKFTRREFNYTSFKHSFHLSDDLSKDDIDAVYENGVLSISIVKKEEAKDYKKTIEIS